MYDLNNIGQQQQTTGVGDFFRGIGTGLHSLVENKTKEIQRQKNIDKLQRFGFNSQAAELLNHIQEVDPAHFTQVLQSLGEGAYSQPQQTQYPQQSVQEYAPEEYEQEQITEPSGEKVSISKEIEKPIAPKGLFEKGLSEKEKAERFKQTKEYRESILNARKLARSDLKDLNRLEELSESGKLDTPGYIEFLKESGFDIPALMNPESEEFFKIQQSFLKNAKQYFGGRVSNYEVEQFLKTIPSLSQSPEGRSRVLSNLKYVARGAEEYYKAYEDILRQNKGVPPYDIQEQVERKIDKRLDKIAEQFKKDVSKPVPKGQNKIITALQSGAGKVAGAPFKLIKSLGNIGAGAPPILPA